MTTTVLVIVDKLLSMTSIFIITIHFGMDEVMDDIVHVAKEIVEQVRWKGWVDAHLRKNFEDGTATSSIG